MEPKGLLPCSKQPVTCPYPEPDSSNPCSPKHIRLSGRPPLVSCLQLLIQYIHSYSPYLEAIFSICNLRTHRAMVTETHLLQIISLIVKKMRNYKLKKLHNNTFITSIQLCHRNKLEHQMISQPTFILPEIHHVLDHLVHHQVYTDLKFTSKWISHYNVSISIFVGFHITKQF